MSGDVDVPADLAWAEERMTAGDGAAAVVERVLGPLTAYDGIHHGDLVRTVEVLIECRWSSTEAARRLFLLRNSILYRRARIEAVSGLRLDDPDTRTLLDLALRIRRRLAVRPAPDPQENSS